MANDLGQEIYEAIFRELTGEELLCAVESKAVKLSTIAAVVAKRHLIERPVDERNGGYYVAGSRVSLDSVVYDFLDGLSPTAIVSSFPSLTLLQVYGAITFYLANQAAIDEYLKQGEALAEIAAQESRERNPELTSRIDEARRRRRESRDCLID